MLVWLNQYSFLAKRFLLLCLLTLMILMQTSCQSLVANKSQPEKAADAVVQKQQKSDTTDNKVSLPNNKLTEDILYKYILAELARQHEDYATAYSHFVSLSESTRDPRIARSALRVALFMDNDEKIFKALQLWINLEQQSGSLTVELVQVQAVVLLKLKKDKLAEQSLLSIFDYLEEEQAMPRIGTILSSLENYPRLKKILSTLKSALKSNFHVNLYSAKFALKYADYKQAEQDINKALQINPDSETAYLLKASLYKKNGKTDQLDSLYQEAIDQLEKTSLIRLEYARELLERDKREEALEQLEIVVEDNSDDYQILYSIGMLAMDIKEYAYARNFFTRVYQLEGHKDEGAFLLGVTAYKEENYEQALKWFNKTKGEKYQYESLLRKSIILSEQKHYTQAIDSLDEYLISSAMGDEKKRVNILRLKADIYNQASLYNKAYQTYSEALLIQPENAELLYSRAMIAEKMDKIDLSEKDLLLIIKNDEKNSNALNALGYILTEKTTRYTDAKQYIEKALKISPKDMAVLDSMGWVLYKLGNIEQSLVYLEKAYNMENDPEIAAHYGEVLWETNQKEKAKKVWQAALKENPQHSILKATMAKYLKK